MVIEKKRIYLSNAEYILVDAHVMNTGSVKEMKN